VPPETEPLAGPEPRAWDALPSTSTEATPPVEPFRAELRRDEPARLMALIEVLLCSGFPTQILLAVALAQAGLSPMTAEGRLSLVYVSALSLADAAVLLMLIFAIMSWHGESPRAILLGGRPVVREGMVGALLIPVVFGLALATLVTIERLAPSLHNVPQNPLQDLVRNPRDAAVFAVVAIVAGALREEIQRAFILERFRRHLGGAWVGIVVFSLAFGAGHVIQGWDAAITTGLLGALWGIVYLARGSFVAPAVSHAGFNLAEIVRFLLVT